MFCKNCGEKLDDSTRFCPRCGVAVTQIPVQTPEQTPVQSTVTPAFTLHTPSVMSSEVSDVAAVADDTVSDVAAVANDTVSDIAAVADDTASDIVAVANDTASDAATLASDTATDAADIADAANAAVEQATAQMQDSAISNDGDNDNDNASDEGIDYVYGTTLDDTSVTDPTAPAQKFDPMTGAPIAAAAPAQKFDSMTGAPIAAAVPAQKFDPMTGAPIAAAAPAQKFDPMTGAPIAAAAPAQKFDPMTGAPIYTIPGEVPAKKSKGPLIVCIVAAVLVIALIAVLVFGVFGKSGFAAIQQKNLLTPCVQALRTLSKDGTQTAISDNLTVTASMEGSGYDDDEMNMLANLALVLRVDIDKDGYGLYGVDVNMSGSPVLSAILSFDKDQIGLYAPALDSNYYVMSIDALDELMANSGTSITALVDNMAENRALVGDMADVMEKYGKMLLSTANSKNVETTTETLTIDGEDVKCTVYTFTPTADDFAKLLEKMGTALGKDKETQTLIYKLYASSSSVSYYDTPMTEEEFIAQWETTMQDYVDNADTYGEALANYDFTWSVAVNGNRIHREEISYTEYDEPICLSYESAGEFKNGRYDALTITNDWGETISYINTCSINGSTVDGIFRFVDEYGDSKWFTYNCDTSKTSGVGIPYGNYGYTDDYLGNVINVDVKQGTDGGSDHLLSINEYGTMIKVNIHSTDKASTITKPSTSAVDVSDYSEDELYAIFSNMGDQIFSLLYQLSY